MAGKSNSEKAFHQLTLNKWFRHDLVATDLESSKIFPEIVPIPFAITDHLDACQFIA
jgi:hypothetical protein